MVDGDIFLRRWRQIKMEMDTLFSILRRHHLCFFVCHIRLAKRVKVHTECVSISNKEISKVLSYFAPAWGISYSPNSKLLFCIKFCKSILIEVLFSFLIDNNNRSFLFVFVFFFFEGIY